MQNKIAIITGANRGVGLEISRLLINSGTEVISLSRTKPDLCCEHFYCDLSDRSSVISSLDSISKKYSRIDYFINNAAVFLEKKIIEMSIYDWEMINDVNLTSPFIIVKSLIPLMLNNNYGKIINISSTAALSGKENQSAYCATKHGLLGLFRSLSLELKTENIHFYNICPGGINTDFTKGTDIFEQLKKQNLIDKKQIAEWVYFLLNQSLNIEIGEIQINRYKKN